MRIVPLDWDGAGNCTNSELFGKVMEFTEREFGHRHAGLTGFKRVFATVRDNGDVNSLSGIVMRYDVPMFHVGRPADGADRATVRDALAATDLQYNRLVSYIEDTGGKGFETFVYVAPDARERWGKWLERNGARDAHRVIVVP